MDDAEFEQRLANPLPRWHPDYDPFYDATDDELAGMIPAAPWSAESQEGTE